jgi:uncharacterized surface protein with fasciclin (FAS1) repeats
MADRTRILRATVLAAPLGALALSAQAADIASTIKEQQQFSTLAKAIEAAGIAETLQGEGPYTIFAPTDEAFDRLPQGLQDALMKEENREQLKTLLQYHVIEGEEIMAEDVLGKQSDVDTVSGDRLSVDGTGEMILLMPEQAGQTQRQSSQGPAQQEGVETEVAEESGMPASEHQQEVLAEEPATEERQTGAQGDVPSSPHQEQVLRDEPAAEQPGTQQQTGQQAGTAQPQTAQESDMPSSPHQEQVLRDEPITGQQAGTAQPQTAQESDMPSSPHQEQVLREQPAAEQQGTQQPAMEQPQTAQESDMPSSPHQEQVLSGEQTGTEQPQTAQESGMPSSPHQEQVLRGQQGGEQQGQQATVVEPDIDADNGVIHAVDALLVPQSVLSTLENAGTPSQGEPSSTRQTGDEQG